MLVPRVLSALFDDLFGEGDYSAPLLHNDPSQSADSVSMYSPLVQRLARLVNTPLISTWPNAFEKHAMFILEQDLGAFTNSVDLEDPTQKTDLVEEELSESSQLFDGIGSVKLVQDEQVLSPVALEQ